MSSRYPLSSLSERRRCQLRACATHANAEELGKMDAVLEVHCLLGTLDEDDVVEDDVEEVVMAAPYGGVPQSRVTLASVCGTPGISQPSSRMVPQVVGSEGMKSESPSIMSHTFQGDSASASPNQLEGVATDSLVNELASFIRCEISDLKREIRQKMAEDKAEIMEAIKAISLQLKSLPLNTDPVVEMDVLHNLPMNSMEEIMDFEKVISCNKEYRQFMLKYLRDRSSNLLNRSITEKIFTGAVNKTVNDICSVLMTNEMGKQFCMKGRNSLKVPFESTFPKIIELIFGTVRSKRVIGSKLEIITIKRSIGEWFRLARLRGGSARSSTFLDDQ